MHTSPNDSNLYRSLILDNQLKVILVQDSEATRSAASLAVRVGHFDDPADREGLAHFLEHMLF
ncbi:protease III precursor [Vibrio ishigakensis]|nr:protease III precursor [Vibrio ishigakensis]